MVTGAELLAALHTVNLQKVKVAGMQVNIRGLTGAQRRLLIDRNKAGTPLEAHELVAMVVCNDDGSLVFTPEEAPALADVDGGEMNRVAGLILELSGLMPEAQEAAAGN